MKKISSVVLLLSLSTASPVFADHMIEPPQPIESDGYDVMMDFFLRPAGIVGTLVGAGLFVGFSPVTALAALAPPHDAFEQLAYTMVCKPFKYTFDRPVGDYNYQDNCHRPVPVAQIPPPPPPPDMNKKLDDIFKKKMRK